MIIVIEGIDGSGKTLLSLALGKYLNSLGRYSVSYIHFPTPDFACLLKEGNLSDPVKATLFATNFLALNASQADVTIVDRYDPSLWVHQGLGTLNPMSEETRKYQACLKLLQGAPDPDMTIWLDIPPEIAYENIKQRDKEPEQTLEELKKLSDAYSAFFGMGLTKYHRLTSMPDLNNIHQLVVDIFGEDSELIDPKAWKPEEEEN